MAQRPARKPTSQLLLFLSGQGVLPNGNPELKRMLSYGAGLDSFGLLCLAYEYFLLYGTPLLDHIVFADTGDPEKQFPGEWPETYEHIRRVAIPLARAAGIPFKVLDGREYPVRGYTSLFELLIDKRMVPSSMPNHRLCTFFAKIERVELYSATIWPAPIRIETWVGLEAGEESRLENDPYAKGGGEPRRSKRFPLMDLGLCRCRLEQYVRRLGLPVPPKSACMYCPAGSKADFRLLYERYPQRFDQARMIDEMGKITKQGIELRLAGNHKKAEPLKAWALSPYKPRPPPCKVCGAPARADKRVGVGGDPLPPGTDEMRPPPSPAYNLRDLVTGDVSASAGCGWAVGLPVDADASAPARLLGEAPDDPLKVRVQYARAGGGEATAVLRPSSVTVWFGRPMLRPMGGDVLHPAVTLAG